MSISVILPVRNGESSVQKAIKSVSKQLRPYDELLIMDDASNDDTWKILSELQSEQIRVFRSEENIGVGRSLNFLIQESRGEFIARMDADDFSLPGRFTKQRKVLESSDVDFLFGSVLIKSRGLILPQFPKKLANEIIVRTLPILNPLAHATMMCRKGSIQNLGGYAEGSSQDYELWLRAALADYKIAKVRWYLLMRTINSKTPSEARKFPPSAKMDELRLKLAKKNRGVERFVFSSSREQNKTDFDELEILNRFRTDFESSRFRFFKKTPM